MYHGDPAGTGTGESVRSINTAAPAWTSPTLDGDLYGEPLIFSGRIYVATENDTVYALSSRTGAVIWSVHVATPVPSGRLPCGDISPVVGITGTPVIDQSRDEIFVVADELIHGSPAHVLVGLNTTSGAIELTQHVDPPGANPANLLQRTGLTLDAGQVIFGMGGNYGDCALYRGRVFGVNEAGGAPTSFAVDAAAGNSQGAIWMGGAAPAIDSSGHIWVTAGNGSVHTAAEPYDDSDSALELSSSLSLLQYYAPSDWYQNNANDLDMSTEPALLSDGQVVVADKSDTAYLLNGAHLGGIGGQQVILDPGCANDIDGGPAVVGLTVFLPCIDGIIAVRATQSPPALRVLWNSRTGGGPPIVAGGLVWTIGQNGQLYGLSPTTGKVVQQTGIGKPANHFPTASVGAGLLLAASARSVVAFDTSSSTTSTTTSTGGLPVAVIGAIVVGGLILVGGIAWAFTRRPKGRHSRPRKGRHSAPP